MKLQDWQREYQCSFEENTEFKYLIGLAEEYYARCEAYDRTVCTGPIGIDGILPAKGNEQAAINAHADRVLHELKKRSNDPAGLKRAIQLVVTRPY